MKFEAESREFAKILRSLEQFIWNHEAWKVRPILETESFLTCSWRSLRSNTLEQFKSKSEKNIGIQKEKLEKKQFRLATIYWLIIFFFTICNMSSVWPKYCEKKLFWLKKAFEIRGWRPRICKIFEIIRTIHSIQGQNNFFPGSFSCLIN